MNDAGEGFLGRWSRRKRAALAQPIGREPVEAPAEVSAEVPAEALEFDPASLPPVESLTAASDFSGFLRAGVPQPLRQAALRRAWTLDPAIRDFIGPADYAWDFNAPNGVPGFALELGGDVTRLLAQAIGALEEAAAGPEEAELPVTEPPVVPAIAASEPVEPLSATDPPLPSPQPRRHGSAMPV